MTAARALTGLALVLAALGIFLSVALNRNACGRLNVTRARVNQTQATVYLVLAKQHPKDLHELGEDTRWQGMVNCDGTIVHPTTFRQPNLQKFTIPTARFWANPATLEWVLAHPESSLIPKGAK